MVDVKLDIGSCNEARVDNDNSELNYNQIVCYDLFHDKLPFSRDSNELDKVGPWSFEILKVLGKGTFAKVFLVRKITGRHAGSFFAMKVLRKAKIFQDRKLMEHTMAERHILEAVQHPFIVRLHYAFQTSAKFYLILDYVNGGELFSYFEQRDVFNEDDVRFFAAEIILAIEHLHRLGIVHRDLKLENILVDDMGHLLLTDFGLSKEFGSLDSKESVASIDSKILRRADSFVGTIEYISPEVFKHAGHGTTVDWWSLGILIYEMIAGKPPFSCKGDDLKEFKQTILRKQPDIPQYFSKEARSLVLALLKKSPEQRLGCGPEGAESVKKHPFFAGLDWKKVLSRQYTSPIKPTFRFAGDTSNFDKEFTRLTPIDSPAVHATPGPTAKALFRGFSFVGPGVIYSSANNIFSSKHCLGDVEVNGNPSTQSTNTGCQSGVSSFSRMNMGGFALKYSIMEEVLGVGSFSVCRRCVDIRTGIHCAVKIVSLLKYDPSREIAVLRRVQGHANIVRLLDVFHDDAHSYIVTELCSGGELLDRIRSKNRFTEDEASNIVRQLVIAVASLHVLGVVHRDLKPENILFESPAEDAKLKLIDFGFAKIMENESANLKTPCFSVNYVAPEVLQSLDTHSLNSGSHDSGTESSTEVGKGVISSIEGYDQSCDLWSCGVITYVLLCGYPPFQASGHDQTSMAILNRVVKGEFSFPKSEWDSVSVAATDLIRGLLVLDPKIRLSAHEVLAHPWLVNRDTVITNANVLMSPGILASQDMSTGCGNVTIKRKIQELNSIRPFLMGVDTSSLAKRRRKVKSSGDSI